MKAFTITGVPPAIPCRNLVNKAYQRLLVNPNNKVNTAMQLPQRIMIDFFPLISARYPHTKLRRQKRLSKLPREFVKNLFKQKKHGYRSEAKFLKESRAIMIITLFRKACTASKILLNVYIRY